VRGEPAPVGVGILVVLGQDVRLDLHHARLAETGRVRARRPLAIVVGVLVGVVVMMMVVVIEGFTLTLDPDLPVTTPAYSTHG
jgi:hypothetical protein